MLAQTNLRVNLLPSDRFEFSKTGKFLGWALTTGRYLVVFTELIVTMAFLSRFWFDKVLTDLREQRLQREVVVDSFKDFESAFLSAQSRVNFAKQTIDSSLRSEEELNAINGLTPKGVDYVQIQISPEKTALSGFAFGAADFSSLLSSLESQERFSEVTVKELRLSLARKPGFDFEIEAIRRHK
ncbi:hypothetical protein HZB78_00060 [Candidatus Collierbacteria bacterium]|nr:hypothetical protein [Candidatus Collierbacteria bacterium]